MVAWLVGRWSRNHWLQINGLWFHFQHSLSSRAAGGRRRSSSHSTVQQYYARGCCSQPPAAKQATMAAERVVATGSNLWTVLYTAVVTELPIAASQPAGSL